MKYTLPFFLVLLSLLLHAQEPSLAWAKNTGSNGDSQANAIAVDAAGNVYTTGSFTGSVDFDPGPRTYYLTTEVPQDIFVSKLDAAGNFVWARSFHGSGSVLSAGHAIAVDGDGNVYITGQYYSKTDFDPGPETYYLYSQSAAAFIVKLNASGNFVWAKNFASEQLVDFGTWNMGHSIKVDAAGNVYTAGYFYGTLDFDPGPGTYKRFASGKYDAFVLKLDVSGNFVWAESFGGNAVDAAHSLCLDASGNVYVTGTFFGNVDFDAGPETYNLTSNENNNMFILKLSAEGNLILAKSAGANGSVTGAAITTDPLGNIYTAGSVSGLADLDPGPGVTYLNGAAGGAFVSKLDAAGNLLWARNMAGSSGKNNAVSVDASGNVYTAGVFVETADFDPGPGAYNLQAHTMQSPFVVKLDPSGDFRWAKTIDGMVYGYDNFAVLDAAGSIYAAGFFRGTANFDPGPTTFNLTASSGENPFFQGNAYVLKWTQPNTTCTPPTFLNDQTIVLDASCNGSDGNISIIPQSGIDPFLYSLDGGATYVDGAASGHTFQGLVAGYYQLRLKDAIGCESKGVTRQVRDGYGTPAFLNDLTIVLDASCEGNDGNISIIPTCGLPPFQYSIDGGMTFVIGPDGGYTFQGLAAGTYQLRLKDASGKESAVVTREVKANAFGNCSGEAASPSLRSTRSIDAAEVSTYPNPTRGQFQVQLKKFGTEKLQVQILDGRGDVVQSRQVNTGENKVINVDLTSKAKGLYFVRVVSAKGVQVTKVVIQ